ncbi:HsdR family type I site-specific deoxyribonuclease [Metamycoplasma hyosynoviae]|uniref:type I restriction endonuclease subunit R n=1 Tax=Metamycoplasma hyosynoviae TaxID=29559 RepID=UPI00235A345A|nr:HsdR family type I site-specific deoxyribonuclease [Metamycoplasma hyosynoviae]MDC8917828.1 HsdR family type I site-specific deoxyribonuclease [Metamycoplasma hyosynoviae]
MLEWKYLENNFERTVIELFEKENYIYEYGRNIHRENIEILLINDFKEYLLKRYKQLNLKEEEIDNIIYDLLSSKGISLYSTMKLTLNKLRKGCVLNRSKYNLQNEFIQYFDYENVENNIFKIVNQFEVKGQKKCILDIVVFINGIPVSTIELKNPSNTNTKLRNAYEQLCDKYAKNIENLMRFSFISVISDGVNTKYGSLFADFEHYFPWKSTDEKKYSKDGIESLLSMVSGLFKHKTLLNLIHHYIYFPDSSKNDLMILPKYSQYYAAELLFENIMNNNKNNKNRNKGGTYFGATGCGKSYTMLFLTKRLTTEKELKSPTVLLLTDRNDLDDQLSKIFESSKEYLIDNNTMKIATREKLYEKLNGITSGGIFLMTIQKFDENIKLLSNRNNIFCISDEAHRTQVNLDATLKIEKDGIKKHYGFAKNLRNAFPNATFIGFTGTPIDATIKAFGPVIASYKMKQAVDDGSTVGISLLSGPLELKLDEKKLAIVDKYYEKQLEIGTNKFEINNSIKEVATVRTIIDNDSRLDSIVEHFIKHYELRIKEAATVKGKAMFVCYDRKIAFKVYKKIIEKRPEWNIKKKTQEDASKFSAEQLNRLMPVEMIKFIATRTSNDEEELYNALEDAQNKDLATLFKDENSNLKIVIVVDMWITGFDCECLDTMYIDKPLEKHSLIQTISRVNRVFEGKDKGLVVDYIGIENSLSEAMQFYSDDINPISEIESSYAIFKEQMANVEKLMKGFDYSLFETSNNIDRLLILNKAIEFIQISKKRETEFVMLVQKLKKAFDVCVGDSRITDSQMFKLHFYCSVRSTIMKLNKEDTPDSERMNLEVKKLVDECIAALENNDEKQITETEIFSDKYLKEIEKIKHRNTKFKILLKYLKETIDRYSRRNIYKAEEFSKRMRKLIDKYNNRDEQKIISTDDIFNKFIDSLSQEAEKIFEDLKKDNEKYTKLKIEFDEATFYDILIDIRDKYGFEYKDQDIVGLAKKIKEIVDSKTKYTDWSSKENIIANLESDIIRLLNNNNYPPATFKDVYNKILTQLKNFEGYQNNKFLW